MKRNEKDRDAMRKEHLAAARTNVDRKDEVQTRVHRSIPELAGDFQALNKNIKNALEGIDSLHDTLHDLKETMSPDDLY